MDVHFLEKHELAPYPLDVVRVSPTVKLNRNVVGFNCNQGTYCSVHEATADVDVSV